MCCRLTHLISHAQRSLLMFASGVVWLTFANLPTRSHDVLLVSQILLNSLEVSCASQGFLRYVALNGQGLFPTPQWHKVACGRASASERGYDRVG
jgi:hypothetical protein